MSEEHEIKEEKEENTINDRNSNQNKEDLGLDDFQEYMKEMELLKTDFSDLNELDLEEIEEMKEAIFEVQQSEEMKEETINEVQQIEEASVQETLVQEASIHEALVEENEIIEEPILDNSDQKESMMIDFSDLGKTDLNELIEMKQATETVRHEDLSSKSEKSKTNQTAGISDELEKRIQEELHKKKKKEKKQIITQEDFIKFTEKRRDKIWYHALNYLTFKVEDHTSSKYLLYDVLKEDTSKSPIDPIPEHQFYFGLGFLLRLSIDNTQIVRYLSGGKFKINFDIEIIKKILEEAGPPIITKPVIEDDVKKNYFKDFLKDDFTDI